MKIYIYPFLTAVIILLGANISYAQFEGRVLYDSYKVDSNGERQINDQFTLFVTPKRILLQGENRYNFIGNIQTEGVLVRLDYEDFVFLTGEEEVLKISRADITSLMNMFGGNKNNQSPPDVNYRRSGETERIQGYVCEKFIFTDKDNADHHSEVWMTKGVNVRWGMFSESWANSQKMLGGSLPLNLMFEEGYFPVRIQSYVNGSLRGVVEATEISESDVARAMVQIPSGVKVLSFQDYLFQKMSRQ